MPIAEPLTKTDGRPIEAGEGAGEQVGAPGAALEDLALVGVGPPLVADAGTGEVDDAVDPLERGGVDGAGRRIPPDGGLALGDRAAHERDHLVAVEPERSGEGAADEAAGTADDDLQGSLLGSGPAPSREHRGGPGMPRSRRGGPRTASLGGR